jgi:hypothetical protein
MSEPRPADDVKLVASLFSPEFDLIERVITEMEHALGAADWISPPLFFDRTRYYEREMGWPLHRRFVSFENLLPPDRLVNVKLATNEIEQRYCRDEKRRVNIDPGYVSAERLVLATGKNYIHRIYLAEGIYADLTLVFRKGGFHPLQWTYPDYADSATIALFNEVRRNYMRQLRQPYPGSES